MNRPAAAAPAPAPLHLPSLDGLRALSIVAVLLSHLPGLPKSWDTAGNFGVRIFFVISGFLITTLLIDEVARTGTLSLPAFYRRRLYRILPAFVLYLAMVALLAGVGFIDLRPGDLFASLTYTMNYHQDRSWYVGHIWSLSVEEQFYLLWPALLLLAGVRRGIQVAACALLAAPLIRVATWAFAPSARDSIGESFESVLDALATGCVLAGVHAWLGQQRRYLAFLQSPLFFLLPVIAIACHASKGWISFDYPVGQTLTNIAIALCIDRWVRYPQGDAFGRLLDAPVVVFVGRISYSLYLWQQLFMGRDGWLVQRFPLNLLLTVAAAIGSFYLVERPFIRLARARHAALPPPPADRKRVPVRAHAVVSHTATP